MAYGREILVLVMIMTIYIYFKVILNIFFKILVTTIKRPQLILFHGTCNLIIISYQAFSMFL